MSETNIRKEFVMPIAVLTIICLVMAALLAFTNGVTDPIIKKAEQQAAQQARLEVLPQAANFERVDIDPAELPSSVTDVYKATNDTGYAKEFNFGSDVACDLRSSMTKAYGFSVRPVQRAPDDVQMPVCDRVETAGIHEAFHPATSFV